MKNGNRKDELKSILFRKESFDNTLFTIGSACFLATTITVVAGYCFTFGLEVFIGGFVVPWDSDIVLAFVQLLLTLALFVPYVFLSVMGIFMAMQIVNNSRGVLYWFNCFLAFGHVIMLTPPAYLAIILLLHDR